MSSEIYEKIHSDILQFDVLGARGCGLPTPRCNLLIQVTEKRFSEDFLELVFDQFTPEGFGIEQFWRDVLTVPGDDLLNDNMTLIWDMQVASPPSNQKIWILSAIEESIGTFRFDEKSSWFRADKSDFHHRPIHALELFGGGMGGWKAAGNFLGKAFHQSWETVAVEQQLDVAMNYAITHKVGLITSVSDLPRNFLCEQPNWMICASICDASWYPHLAEWGVDALYLSPPCQPWSTAATSPGLDRFDGKLTPLGLLLCKWFRPHFVALEQVVGFQSHPHKPVVIRILQWLGYKIVFEKVVDLADQSPTSRQRFLLVAIRVHSSLPSTAPRGWFRQDFMSQPLKCCIRLSSDELAKMLPNSRVLHLASDPAYSKGYSSLTPEQTIDKRVYHDGQTVPTFMARYGFQHEIDDEFLKKFGYLGHFVSTGPNVNSFRFWHPAEIIIIHGVVNETFLPESLQLAWHIVGNQICLPHALLLVADMFWRMHHFDFSPFVVFSRFQQLRFQGPTISLVKIPGGFFVSPNEEVTINPHVVALTRYIRDSIPFTVWHPDSGFSFPVLVSHEHSNLGEETVSNGTISPTIPFSIGVLARYEGEHSFNFWCDSSVPSHHLVSLWFDQVTCAFVTPSETGAPCILIRPSSGKTPPSQEPWEVIVMLDQGVLTLYTAPREQNLLEHEKLSAVATTLFDQFGAISSHQKVRFDLVVLTTPMVVEPCRTTAVYLFAAFRLATFDFHWDPSLQDTVLLIHCPEPGVSLLLEFWTALFSSSQLATFGLCCQTEPEVCGIRFLPIANSPVIPPAAFRLALGVAAVRSIISLLPEGDSHFVRMTWFSRPLWAGFLATDSSIQLLINIVSMGLGTTLQIDTYSIVHQGRKVDPTANISQLVDPNKDELVLHVVPQLSGGGSSKQQQKVLAKNAIASVLLEHGLEIGWVKNTVEALHDKFGIPKLQQVLTGPTLSQKLKDIKLACTELGIHFPTPAAPTNQANVIGPPKNKRRKENTQDINPQDYKVDAGFFFTSDKKPASQLTQLRANANGFCLVLPSDAIPWIRANQAISTDELGAIVLGKLQIETTLSHEPVTMPCTDQSGQAVLLTGTLIQLGGKPLSFARGDPKQVDAVAGHLMSITLFKDDWSPERWMEATSNPISFIARMLELEQLKDCVQAMWGRSLRAGRAQATPAQATTVQVHCTVVDAKKDMLLQASGLNSLFFTPKTRAGRIDSTFKIIWIEGDMAQATGLATQIPHCLGLVKGRSSFGLRFEESKFVEAWNKIYPGQSPPPRTAGNLVFKIEGLPFGCTSDMLTKWGDKIGWKFVAFKALGPSSWLVKSDQQFPAGLLHFNTTPVLVRHLPPREVDKTPLLVGPRPKQTTQRDTMTYPSDPWANYTGPRLQPTVHSTPPARTLEGPVASKMKEQDEKISSLQTELKKLAIQSDKQFASVEKRMDTTDQQQAAQFGKMEASITALTNNIDQALKSSVQQNATLMEQKMNELKALFQTKRPRDDDPME